MHVHPWIPIQQAGLARGWTLAKIAHPHDPSHPTRYKLTSPEGDRAIWYLDAEAERVAVTREGFAMNPQPTFLSFEDGLRLAEGRLVFGEAVPDPVATDPELQGEDDRDSNVGEWAMAGSQS